MGRAGDAQLTPQGFSEAAASSAPAARQGRTVGHAGGARLTLYGLNVLMAGSPCAMRRRCSGRVYRHVLSWHCSEVFRWSCGIWRGQDCNVPQAWRQ